MQTPLKQGILLLLSALLWQAAFYEIEVCGFLILFVPLPLIFVFTAPRRPGKTFLYGLFWGGLLYAPHFYWFLDLLLKKSQASVVLSCFFYGVVVFWFTLLSGVWFLITGNLVAVVKKRVLAFLLVYLMAGLYSIALDRYAFYPLLQKDGYPFINPLICLAHYKPIIKFCHVLMSVCTTIKPAHSMPLPKELKIVHLQLVKNQELLTPIQQVKQLLMQIKAAVNVAEIDQHFLFVAPESSLPFVLDNNTQAKELLQKGIYKNTELLVGSLSLKGDKNCQTLFYAQPGLITKIYDKRHLIFGMEKIPTYFKKLGWIEQPFLKGRRQFVCGVKDNFNASVIIAKKIQCIPIICSELFFMPLSMFYQPGYTKAWFIFFMNDSWFNSYLFRIMMQLVALKSALLQRAILVVGHKKKTIFVPPFN